MVEEEAGCRKPETEGLHVDQDKFKNLDLQCEEWRFFSELITKIIEGLQVQSSDKVTEGICRGTAASLIVMKELNYLEFSSVQ